MVETKQMDEASVHAWAMRVGSLLEGAEAGGAAAEQWARRLGERAARDDALNVGGMLAAAGAPGDQLATTLAAGGEAGARLRGRLDRLEGLLKGAPDAVLARSGAARAEHGARSLLRELEALTSWLDVPDLELEPELASEPGRQRALALAEALRTALKNTEVNEAARRLSAVRARLGLLGRARERLAGALARHVSNLLIHRGNEAAAAPAPAAAAAAAPPRHHAELRQYRPFMRWLKEMDEKKYDALLTVYISTWSSVYKREVRAACETARAQLAGGGAPGAGGGAPGRGDEPLDHVLTLVDMICNAEQEFCTQFFYLDVDVKPPPHDGDRSSTSGGAGAGAGEARRGAGEARRVLAALLPDLEAELVALVSHVHKTDQYGAMRALACISRRVLAPGEAAASGGGGGSGALAAAAVAAKRLADGAVQERVEAMQDAVRQASKRSRAGIYPFFQEFEELTAACEAMFSRGGRRADVERWYVTLADAMLRTVAGAHHPRTPRAVLHMENYHRLAALLAALRLPATDAKRVEAHARYNESLRSYVAASFGRPLGRLQHFFDGVHGAVAAGAKETEVQYRAAFSKQELKKVLALYPKEEVCRSLHALHRTVLKEMSPDSALLQVVWRAMQEEFIQQHQALQTRIAACYPGAGLALPLTIQDILEAFSDIARGN